MAYDKTLPTNATKIRNYPTVLTDNFAAIEEGDLTLKHWQVNFIERNAVPGAPPPANDPTRADDTIILFSKQDGSGETELFCLDDRSPANNFQLTENGRIGSASTNISLDNFTFDSGTTNYNENNIINAQGKVTSGGTAVYVRECTVARLSTGLYRITFDTARANTNYSVQATADDTGNARVCKIGSITTASFTIRVVNGSGTNRDNGFQFTVVGGF